MKGTLLLCFLAKVISLDGAVWDAGTEEAFDEIHHRFSVEFDSYICLRPQADNETHIFEFRGSEFEDTKGHSDRFWCFRGLKAP
ncbi:MAG: hypothetical protein WCS17_05995, partial [Prevotella sp.]